MRPGGWGRELISGIDDHSRFCVIATVVRRATARAVCRAFLAAVAIYGIPEEVLTDIQRQAVHRAVRPGHHFHDGVIALLHDTQLHEHGPATPCRELHHDKACPGGRCQASDEANVDA
jgi:hypothetical protein